MEEKKSILSSRHLISNSVLHASKTQIMYIINHIVKQNLSFSLGFCSCSRTTARAQRKRHPLLKSIYRQVYGSVFIISFILSFIQLGWSLHSESHFLNETKFYLVMTTWVIQNKLTGIKSSVQYQPSTDFSRRNCRYFEKKASLIKMKAEKSLGCIGCAKSDK